MPPIARKIRISIVSYLNTLPFRWAIGNSDLDKDAEISEDIPSLCAQKLINGDVDLALVPVAILPRLEDHHIVSDFCIGADGIVDSVKLYHDVPVNEIRKVLLDYQSRTSVNLTRVLFKFLWKTDPEFAEAAPGFEKNVTGTTAAVVIGDRTFDLNGRHPFETDLAQAWKDLTGLPFVFAAWVSRKELPDSFISKFNGLLRDGVDNIERSVRESPPHPTLPQPILVDYLQSKIDYRLDARKMEALELFLDYLKRL